MDLQLFYRDTEQADTWMVKQESFLVNQDLGDSLDSVEVRSPFIIIFFLIKYTYTYKTFCNNLKKDFFILQ